MLHFIKKHWWGVGFSVVLTAYSVFTVLDTFLIPKDVMSIESDSNTLYSLNDSSSQSASESVTGTDSDTSDSSSVIVTDTSYDSDSVSINISTIREYNTNIYVADVQIKDITHLSSGLAGGVFGRNITDTTSDIAKECGAILAINGDFYGFRDSGPVIRNGVVYRSTARNSTSEALAIYNNGDMQILKETDVDTSELLSDGVVQLLSFGPGLVNNGKVCVSTSTEVDKSMTSNPRTAIGMISPLHYVLVVSDGRTSESEGLSLYELAGIMQDMGCETAYNLDGGGSSTMWFNGNVVNNPTTNGKTISERKVSDIVYIK